MSNSRSFRRRLKDSRRAPRTRYPYQTPSLSTVRRWMKQLEANGDIEAKGVERTGKPGRPAVQYGLTKQGRERNWTTAQIKDMITCALRDRKYKQVPHLLWLLAAKDPDEAKRAAERISALVPDAVLAGHD